MAHQLTSLSSQRGASATSVVLLIVVIVILGKIGIAIVPAHIGDYQLDKVLTAQLIEANKNGDTPKQFIERVDRQLSINASYDTKAEEIFTFTNKKIGQLVILKKYTKTNNLFGNVDIVNRFEKEINSTTAE